MKELTICETLASPVSPHARALGFPQGYGTMLGGFLAEKGLLKPRSRILEVGGGYGTLMEGLLSSYGHLIRKAVMVDLSPMLLRKQRERLKGYPEKVCFIQSDIHEFRSSVNGCDLILVNEVIGDLDVATGLDPHDLPEDVSSMIVTYGLEVPRDEPFNLNIGAIRLVESICRQGVPAFISEHSSDPVIPDAMPYLAKGLSLDSFPREIRLHAHSEYTIRFSHLAKVARSLGRTTQTGPLIEMLGGEKLSSWRFIFSSHACSTDTQELIYEFLDHIREYRWLIIS